jgi:hypothetical protein
VREILINKPITNDAQCIEWAEIGQKKMEA